MIEDIAVFVLARAAEKEATAQAWVAAGWWGDFVSAAEDEFVHQDELPRPSRTGSTARPTTLGTRAGDG